MEMPLLDSKQCENVSTIVKGIRFNETMHICAGGLKGKSVCSMDSGGPLQCLGNDGLWYEVGITSFGFTMNCGLEHWPDAFTRISSYIDWIESTISHN